MAGTAPADEAPGPRPYPGPIPVLIPSLVNLIGLGMDDPHAADDVEALRLCSPPRPHWAPCSLRCTLEEVRRAPYADVNLVLRGKGVSWRKP